jgi:4-hydroxy-tetrahydrodipicolinate reductase
MEIILLGYGKMGKIIERIAQDRGHVITARIDVDNPHELKTAVGDVVIEFSHPDAAFDNIKACLERNLPIVCGTTGWLDRKSAIEALCQEKKGTFFYASNYSLGVNLFFKLNEQLAKMMENFAEYDVTLDETHHLEKKDAPSGTAITLAEGVMRNLSRKKDWNRKKTENPTDLFIESFRVDAVPGTHTVKYESVVDSIEIKHTAHSREGFALGAVMVAEWLQHRTGVLTMDDYLKF